MPRAPPRLPPLYTAKNIVLILAICIEAAGEGALASMLTPILPLRASALGASESELVLLFSLFPAAVLFSSPAFGYLSGVLGRESVLYGGLLLAGASSIAFGVTRSVPLLCVTRVLTGAGSAAVWSATFALVADIYPFRTTIVIGFCETATGLGAMFGPPAAAFLANRWGFALPFMCIGGLFLLLTVVMPIALRFKRRPKGPLHHIDRSKTMNDLGPKRAPSEQLLPASPHSLVCSLLTHRTMLLSSLCVLMAEVSTLALSPFYTDFYAMHPPGHGLTLGRVAWLLFASGVAYAVTAPAVGHAAYWLGSLEVMAMGLVACGLGTVFLAAQFLIPGFNRLTAGASFAVLLAAFALQGVGAALAFIPALPVQLNVVYPLGPRFTGAVSGCFYALMSVGQAVGPFAGFALTSLIGFEWSAVVLGASLVALAPLMLLGRSLSSDDEAIFEVSDEVVADDAGVGAAVLAPTETTPLLARDRGARSFSQVILGSAQAAAACSASASAWHQQRHNVLSSLRGLPPAAVTPLDNRECYNEEHKLQPQPQPQQHPLPVLPPAPEMATHEDVHVHLSDRLLAAGAGTPHNQPQ